MLYFSEWTESQYDYFKDAKYVGNTATFPGFYAPQGRQLRLKAVDDKFLETLNDLGVTNFEMETLRGASQRQTIASYIFNIHKTKA
jgi:uridine phosphorylase